LLDDLTSNVLLPVAGFGLALFGGWIMAPAALAAELHLTRVGASLLRALLRFLVPLAVAVAAFAAVRF
jgi:SNF family Na+-dependent transporter